MLTTLLCTFTGCTLLYAINALHFFLIYKALKEYNYILNKLSFFLNRRINFCLALILCPVLFSTIICLNFSIILRCRGVMQFGQHSA